MRDNSRALQRLALAMLLALTFADSAPAAGGELVVRLPDGAAAKSATATNRELKTESPGAVSGQTVTFKGLLPETPYDVKVELTDGAVLQGVDLAWHGEEPAKPDAGPLSDDDREALRAIVQDVKDFYNKKDVLLLRGDHDRAVALARLVRDSAFHADKGGEVIWRVELWYFKFHFGGWEKIAQVNKVLRRERFPSAAACEAAVGKIKWTPELGGVTLAKDGLSTTIVVGTPGKIEPPSHEGTKRAPNG